MLKYIYKANYISKKFAYRKNIICYIKCIYINEFLYFHINYL